MSDASSVVTYTSVYTDSEPWRYYREDSAETGPLRVIVYGYDGLPIQPGAPHSLDYVSGPEHPPSPDYVPGLEHPPSPAEVPYVPEPEYPEYLEPSDDEAPLEDQPLPVDASPIAASPDYVADSDPEEDPEEDPKDDQADYPADEGDGDDKPSDDDDDDYTDDKDPEEEPFEEDDEEEEHLALADSPAVPIMDHTCLRRARKTVRPEPPMSTSMEACIARQAALLSSPLLVPSLPLPLPSPLTTSPTNTGAPLSYRAAKIRMRALLPSTSRRTDILEADMPPRKKACLTTLTLGFEIGESSAAVDKMMEIALTTLEGVNERVTELDTIVRQRTYEFEIRFEDAQFDRALLRARVNTLFRDRPDHHRTTMLMDREAMYSREAWAFSMDRSSAIAAHVRTLEIQVLEARDLELQEGPAEAGSSCVAVALAERDADRSMNSDNSNDSGTCRRRKMTTPRECSYTDFLKCQPMSFKALKEAVGQDVAYAMPWAALKRMITDKYCPRGKIQKLEFKYWNLKVKGVDLLNYNHRFQEVALMCDKMFPEESAKVERYIGGLPNMIHGSVKASKPQSMQEAIEFATEMISKKMLTHAERQAEHKRKFDDTSRNTQHQ
nr:reverse transcriptase domain-containing protein [Tanacetum cinerariifolium]